MNRIDSMFAELKKQNKKALITFITAGDPDFDTTEQLVLEMERQGANLIELGVPFSDPIAEGPIIQEASLRSLQCGTTLEGIFFTYFVVSRSRFSTASFCSFDSSNADVTYAVPIFWYSLTLSRK